VGDLIVIYAAAGGPFDELSAAVKEAVRRWPKSNARRKKPPKRVLVLPDLEHAMAADLNNLTPASRQPTYDRAIR
jgi:hypothetical protein